MSPARERIADGELDTIIPSSRFESEEALRKYFGRAGACRVVLDVNA